MSKVPTVIIAGMHRSGTSAMAGALAGLGIAVGPDDDFLVPTPDNPAGYYENHTVVNCNDTILQTWFWEAHREQHLDEYFSDVDSLDQFGWLFGAWSPPTERLDDQALASLSMIVAQIDERAKQGTPVILKDPRLSLLLPLWITRLERPVVIIMLRHPDEVADSLARRDRLPRSLGYGLWLNYNNAVFAGSEQVPRIVIDYGDLLEDPQSTLQQVMQFLKDNGWKPPENTADAAAASLRPELHRERARTGACPAALQQYFETVRAGSTPPHTHVETDWECGLVVPLLRKLEHTAGVLRHELQQKQIELKNTQNQLHDTQTQLTHVSQRFLASQHELVRMDRHPVVGRVIRLMRQIKRDPDFGKPTLSS